MGIKSLLRGANTPLDEYEYSTLEKETMLHNAFSLHRRLQLIWYWVSNKVKTETLAGDDDSNMTEMENHVNTYTSMIKEEQMRRWDNTKFAEKADGAFVADCMFA
jgi:hypothetical protein